MVSPAITASFTPDYCSSLLDESSANTLCIRFPACTPKPGGASPEAVCILPFFCLTIRGRASGLLPHTAIWLLRSTAQTSGLHMGRLAFQASLFPSPSTPLSLCLKWFCLSISKPGQKFLLGALERVCILLPTQMCSISTHLVYTLSQTGRKKTGFFPPTNIVTNC